MGIFINPAACGPNVVLAISGIVEIRLKGRRILRRQVNYNRIDGGGPVPLRDLSFECSPFTDGAQTYVITLTGIGGSALRPGVRNPVPVLPPLRGGRRTARLACPTTADRQDAEVRAWRRLGLYNPATGAFRTSGGPSDILRGVIGRQLPFRSPRGVWNAHHIVPAREPSLSVRIVQAGAFRCRVYPNQSANGVWLRARGAREGTKLYRSMPSDRARTWHPLTYGESSEEYFRRLSASLVG